LKLLGAGGNSAAIGARVELELEDVAASAAGGERRRVMQTSRAGEGYLAQSSAWLHFGLGAAELRGIRVHWPDGQVEDFEGEADRFLVLRQSSGRAEAFVAPRPPDLVAGELHAVESDASARIVSAAPLPVPSLDVIVDGRDESWLGVEIGGGPRTARARLLSLFSRTCAPCARELVQLSGARAELEAAGVELRVLAVDPSEEAEAVLSFLRRTGTDPSLLAWATPQALEVLDALAGHLRDDPERLGLPASFLIDRRGRLQALYVGAVEPGQVIADAKLEELEADPRRLTALPFHGRFLQGSDEADLEGLARTLAGRGLQQAADELRRAQVELREGGAAELQVEFGKALHVQQRLEEAAAHFEQAVAADSSSIDGWKGAGYCRHRLQDLEGAREAYARALELDPGDDRNRANLALVLADLGRFEEARSQLAELVRIGSEYVETVAQRLR
jgi:tetratricopeptide (TPR) repeat protein